MQYEAITKIRGVFLQFGKPGCTARLRVDFTLHNLCHLSVTECLGPPCPGARGQLAPPGNRSAILPGLSVY